MEIAIFIAIVIISALSLSIPEVCLFKYDRSVFHKRKNVVFWDGMTKLEKKKVFGYPITAYHIFKSLGIIGIASLVFVEFDSSVDKVIAIVIGAAIYNPIQNFGMYNLFIKTEQKMKKQKQKLWQTIGFYGPLLMWLFTGALFLTWETDWYKDRVNGNLPDRIDYIVWLSLCTATTVPVLISTVRTWRKAKRH